MAQEVAAWLLGARDAARGASDLVRIKPAESWLKKAAAGIRDDRFGPIAEKAGRIWERLRQQSHVELGRIQLTGDGTRRRVVLDVTVDGVAGAALGVMSQGELHSLALSLFVPRATLPESPFRFIVIDDPVQSMDPARVDGLARVLESASADRQVLVFTHDDRLPEAVRRFDIAAEIVEVTRRENSVVEVRRALDPVGRYLEDALAVAGTAELPVVGGGARGAGPVPARPRGRVHGGRPAAAAVPRGVVRRCRAAAGRGGGALRPRRPRALRRREAREGRREAPGEGSGGRARRRLQALRGGARSRPTEALDLARLASKLVAWLRGVS